MSSDMSKSDTPRASTPVITAQNTSSGTPLARTTPALTVSPTTNSRMRPPVPPSPLSRIDAEPSRSPTRPNGSTPLHLAQSSPCFIHSHLDRNGNLQDWLKRGEQQNYPSRQQSTQNHHPHHQNPSSSSTRPQTHHIPTHQHHTQVPPHQASTSASTSRVTSPTHRRPPSNSGYESDLSIANGLGASAILDGDLVDDEEDGGSITKQLAETAQGVREMSKELGRTRVRSRIQHVLIVTKARDNRLIQLTRELALYLMQKRPVASPDSTFNRPVVASTGSDRGMVVYVDAQLRTSKRFDAEGIKRDYPHLFQPVVRRRSSSSASLNNMSTYPSSTSVGDLARRQKDEGQLRYWTGEMCSNSPHLFDFVVTLGGDGTVLFTSWLFQKIVPPVLPFALGSLGFLTNFDFANYKQHMDKVIHDGIRVNLRMRFTCTVYRAIAPDEIAAATSGKRKAVKKPGGEILMSKVDKEGWEALEGQNCNGDKDCLDGKDREIMCFSTRPVEQFEVLNDLVVDRGPSPYVSLLEVFGDEHHLTTVQADGLTVSTPTGSTAYSLSAGGSLVHPQIPALLITPICPHTLSFRPMLLPDSMELRICVPYNSRSTAWASFDGRGRVELKQGDHIKVTASKYPFPTVCADKASTDWFGSISRTLRWNEREKQKSFVVVEEDSEPAAKTATRREGATGPNKVDKIKENDSSREDAKGADQIDGADKPEDAEEDDEEEDFDIDDKSGGETTGSSPQPDQPVNDKVANLSSTHRTGVDSPDRFASSYDAPPPLSQRHLVEAMKAAEIKEKEHETGQRDDIRSDSSAFRVNAGPPGRGTDSSPEVRREQRTPRARHAALQRRGEEREKKGPGKAKAFAFFGQDDSASDLSDDQSDI